MGWGSIYRRRLKVFTLSLIIYLDYKAAQRKARWASKAKIAGIWEKTHMRNARRVLNLIIEMEGLWVKLGQYLSTRADVLPQAYIVLLKQLQDSLPPRPFREVQQTIEKQLGKSMGDVFAKFVEKPLATASIAQVHQATLKDGREVVVKVQHPDIKDIILDDLRNAKSIVDWIAWAEPQYDFNPMIDEWCKEAPKELDFNHEAENTRAVSKNLQYRNRSTEDVKIDAHVDVVLPEVIQSTEKVLILEFMDGIRLNDLESLEAFDVDKQRIVEEITRAYSHQIYIDGFFNGDPHPGNFLVSKTPPHRPILLDFGLTKSLTNSMKQALAKMFLAAVEGDHVALLSAFAEMGLKLRLDIPEQAMDITSVIFRSSTPANEAYENVKMLSEQRTRNLKVIQEKMKMNEKEMARFNPIDAFPSDAVLFFRVLHLLRGLSSSLNVRIDYKEIMRPFAESTLQGSLNPGFAMKGLSIHDSKVLSNVEGTLRQHLLELGADKILGIQVCAYKDGQVIIDTAAGRLGRYDPRPVQPDSLFPVFSATKGITTGMLHWLVDNGKLKYEETVANIWPDFKTCKKDGIKVHHVLNHTSGLHNALADIISTDPLVLSDWDEVLRQIAMTSPQMEPGSEQLYHYLSFGWLCGGIIEYASGKKFQEVLEEAIVRPLNIQGEMYIGIPPGVESRLAALTLDVDDLAQLAAFRSRTDLPGNLREGNLVEMAAALPVLFNALNTRRAIIPAANGHCSARALARYYAALATRGSVPPAHTSNSKPVLGSHPHTPQFPSVPRRKKKSSSKSKEVVDVDSNTSSSHEHSENCRSSNPSKMYSNPKIHDAFMGIRDYANLVLPDGMFGLGFRRFNSADGRLASFGHSGIGGSTGFCNIEHNFAVAVTVNKMSLGSVTRSIIRLVCSEMGIPVPLEFAVGGERGPDMQMNLG